MFPRASRREREDPDQALWGKETRFGWTVVLTIMAGWFRLRVLLTSSVNTTVAAINRLPRPYPTPRTRNTVYERRAWRVKAQIVQFKLEDDSDIHLVLYWVGRYMIAEMPFAGCLPQTTRDRRAIVAARAGFVRRCGFPTSSWQSLGAVAFISGVGFWDIAHGQTGAARNYAELHPVTALRIAAGCG
jgi:hypothetical protein